MVSGAARGQALLGPMWAGLTPDSKGDPTGDTGEPDRRRQETAPHLSSVRTCHTNVGWCSEPAIRGKVSLPLPSLGL